MLLVILIEQFAHLLGTGSFLGRGSRFGIGCRLLSVCFCFGVYFGGLRLRNGRNVSRNLGLQFLMRCIFE